MAQDVPDVYAESVQVGLSPFGVALSFGKHNPGQTSPSAPETTVIVRMSIEHAKVMAIILRRQVKQYEAALGTEVPLQPHLYTQLSISKQEDW